ILRFNPQKVMAHDRVRDFYNSLYSIDSAATAGPSGELVKKELVKKEVVDQKPLGGLVLERDPWEEDDEALTAMYAGR
ncbi:MAG: hypothetical protein LQ350_008731, partial [Teloschistes chrysophthalmus]